MATMTWTYAVLPPAIILLTILYAILDSIGWSTSLQTFTWERAALNSWQAPVVAAALYLAAIALLWWRAASSSKSDATATTPPKSSHSYEVLSRVQAVHNVVLCAWSAVMCLGATYAVVQRYLALARSGQVQAANPDSFVPPALQWFICESPATPASGSLYFWAYVYYMSKFYEFADTYLQVLKSGTVHSPYLHLFHHALVPLMAWLWLQQRQSLMFIGLMFNTFVHIPMYWYYSITSTLAARAAVTARAAATGSSSDTGTGKAARKPWWGSYITLLQIVQFVTSIACLMLLLLQFVQKGATCSGLSALAFNTAFNIVLLAQFVNLFSKKQKKQ